MAINALSKRQLIIRTKSPTRNRIFVISTNLLYKSSFVSTTCCHQISISRGADSSVCFICLTPRVACSGVMVWNLSFSTTICVLD
uniref:Putative ovule protein n=1 Tax=Solanum chacoense TaxID=4108 RepID=A0A0V0H8A7_SOLCH